MNKSKNGWRITDELDLTPGLFITFKGLDEKNGSIFHYNEVEFLDRKSLSKFRMRLPDYPMDRTTWEYWACQSANSAAKAVIDKIYIEILIANEIKATYLTGNTFTANLLTTNISSKESVETASATQFLNLELPFLDNIDIKKLMTIRTDEADTFTNFRLELEKELREVRTIKDTKELKIRQENIIHEFSKVQMQKIEQKLKDLKRKVFANSVIALGGLAATVQTGGGSLIASACAAFSGYKTYLEYKSNLTENPSYLLWKVLKK